MKKLFIYSGLITLLVFSQTGMAGHRGGNLHLCLKAASAIKEGYYAKVEYLTLTSKGVDTYEIEIHDNQGIEWELLCDISKGNIYEIEREVKSTDDPLFKRHMKISEKEAAKIANELYKGKVVHTEFEIEANGSASYEFDIFDKPGTTYKVEVDATTGEIVEVAIEKWDIGREANE